jgi:hypothetical protein
MPGLALGKYKIEAEGREKGRLLKEISQISQGYLGK